MRIARLLELAVVAAFSFQAMPSQAQPYSQTYVKSDGAGGCSTFADRCVFLYSGVENASDGGTVNVLDANSQISITIDKGISILALSGQNLIEETANSYGGGFAGIIVNTASAETVTISGVGVDYHAYPYDGIVFFGSGILHVSDCIFRGSSSASHGVKIVPTGPSEIYISNCVIADNGGGSSGGGIFIRPTGSGSAKVVLDNVNVNNNVAGIYVDGSAAAGNIDVTVRNSTIVGSATFGLKAVDSGGGATNVMIEGSSLSNNTGAGVLAVGSNVTVRVRNSTLTRNERGLNIGAPAKVISHGGNVVAGNFVADGAFTSTVAQQ